MPQPRAQKDADKPKYEQLFVRCLTEVLPFINAVK